MQAIKNKADKDRPKPIPMPIQFTTEELLKMDEAYLLKFVVCYHQFMQPAYGATKEIASALGVEPQTISNYLAGKGQPGLDQLIVLLNYTKCPLVNDWIQARIENLNKVQ